MIITILMNVVAILVLKKASSEIITKMTAGQPLELIADGSALSLKSKIKAHRKIMILPDT